MAAVLSTFRVGTVFLHGSWLEADKSPAVCRVTAVRRGVVYYGFGADARKGRYTQTPEKLLANGARIVDPDAEPCSCNGSLACDCPPDVRAFMVGPVPPPDPRNDWPVHRPAAWDAPIPGKHWAAGCEPGGDYDPETRSYAGSGPRVRPDGVCEGCGAAACPECGHEVYDGECDCPPVTS